MTATGTDSPSKDATASLRILIVDDYPTTAETLAKWLTRLGYQVQMAKDGEAALETAKDFLPDVILLDLGIPKLNGYEAAREIRRQPWGKNIFIVAVTGFGRNEDRERTRAAGFDAHLLKPMFHSELKALLDKRSGKRSPTYNASAEPVLKSTTPSR